MVNKKIVIIVTIIAIILVSGIVYISLNRESQEQYTFSEETVENQVKNNVENDTNKDEKEENVVEENKIDDEIESENETENKVDDEIEENEVANTTSDEKEDDKKDETEKLTSEDKAIDLVKKEWGENDNTVYYYVEEQVSDNVYIISVRDQATTQDLSIYRVDVSSESVEKD